MEDSLLEVDPSYRSVVLDWFPELSSTEIENDNSRNIEKSKKSNPIRSCGQQNDEQSQPMQSVITVKSRNSLESVIRKKLKKRKQHEDKHEEVQQTNTDEDEESKTAIVAKKQKLHDSWEASTVKKKRRKRNRKRGRLNTDGIDKQQKDQKSCGHNPIRISHEEEKGKKSGENNDAYNNMNEELQKKNRDDITEKMKHQQRSNKKKLKTDKKIISKQMTSSRGFILSTKTSQDAVTSSHLNKTKTQKKKHKKEETSLKSTKLSVEKTHQLTRKFKRKRKFLLFRTRDSGKALKTHQQSDKHTKTKVHSKKRKHVDLVVPSTGLTNPLPDKQLSRGDTEQQKSRTNAQQQQLSVVNDVQQSNYQPKCNERMKPKRKKIRSKLKNIRKDNRPDHLKPPHLRVITETRFPVLGIKD